MNKLTEIVGDYNSIVKKANDFSKTITDEKGLYEWLKIGLDVYINNNPTPTIYKESVINCFFAEMNIAYEHLKKDYKIK